MRCVDFEALCELHHYEKQTILNLAHLKGPVNYTEALMGRYPLPSWKKID